ncbi:ceramide glucosyltransferase [Rhodobacter veldkampii DSM 11550]|uniref:Ceramide glucosyltransferase n=1 Tax=Phaeovulum veldkampii DSM 11550 TaxID=1185920 RepID=A0A2T4JI81_9RHOB|nr:ceramide glucosyltransferase [Phaeovulum veldkampii]MBK5947157.1 ceramide glucosyltransferase [Phaeovulum veldkampii DSM 11550]PTE17620.1 ceramide glucosyltransferase [Phaeovulum veldkampii DSM 11550]TDQ57560.1 ceramide glucosyltransferase [Phaeovulum veldkampii DSM 11550]
MQDLILIVLAVFCAAALALHLASAVLVAARLRRAKVAPAMPRVLPQITLLRPVCGLDPLDAETLGSSFGLDYPTYEVIFCAASADDPVVPLIHRLIAAHSGTRARLMIGEDRITTNPKLNNLAKGWAAARSDWIVMADSNLLLPPDYLRTLVAAWTPGTGLVSSPPVGIRPQGLWGAVECAFLNAYQARWQLAADQVGLGFAQGKTLFWNRKILDYAGGLAALGAEIAEDVNATKLVRAAGLNVRLTPQPFAQPIGQRSFAEVWGRQLRWARVRRLGFPALFVPEVLTGALAPMAALTAVVAAGAAPLASLPAYALVWYGTEAALARGAGWPMGPRDLAAALLRDLMVPAVWTWAWAGRDFVWRGNTMAAPARPATPV